MFLFFFKTKTAYDMLISDWSSDVCSSDLELLPPPAVAQRDGDRALGVLLSDDVLVESGDDRLGSQLVVHGVLISEGRRGRSSAGQALRDPGVARDQRSEERRVGKACVRTRTSRWPPNNLKKKKSGE